MSTKEQDLNGQNCARCILRAAICAYICIYMCLFVVQLYPNEHNICAHLRSERKWAKSLFVLATARLYSLKKSITLDGLSSLHIFVDWVCNSALLVCKSSGLGIWYKILVRWVWNSSSTLSHFASVHYWNDKQKNITLKSVQKHRYSQIFNVSNIFRIIRFWRFMFLWGQVGTIIYQISFRLLQHPSRSHVVLIYQSTNVTK